MRSLLVPHHSIGDWDKSSTSFALSTTRYTSAPTSLRSTVDEGPIMLCNHASTLCLPQGRLTCQTWCNMAALALFFFRNQCPIGSVPNFLNSYYVQLDHVGIRLQEMVNGVITWNYSFGPELPRNKWVNVEITWWNYPIYDSFHPLAVQFRAYYDGTWHDYGRGVRDLGRWWDSSINRVGLKPSYAVNFFDDTNILAPVWPPPVVNMLYTSMLSAWWMSVPFGGWRVWDLSTVIPADAVAVEVIMHASVNNVAGVRPFNSPLDRRVNLGAAPNWLSATIQCEVGADRKIETLRLNNTDIYFAVIGYWTAVPA